MILAWTFTIKAFDKIDHKTKKMNCSKNDIYKKRNVPIGAYPNWWGYIGSGEHHLKRKSGHISSPTDLLNNNNQSTKKYGSFKTKSIAR